MNETETQNLKTVLDNLQWAKVHTPENSTQWNSIVYSMKIVRSMIHTSCQKVNYDG